MVENTLLAQGLLPAAGDNALACVTKHSVKLVPKGRRRDQCVSDVPTFSETPARGRDVAIYREDRIWGNKKSAGNQSSRLTPKYKMYGAGVCGKERGWEAVE